MIIQFSRNGAKICECTEEEVQAVLDSRAVLPTDYYWHEGMAGWLPVSGKWTISLKKKGIPLGTATAAREAVPPKLPPPLLAAGAWAQRATKRYRDAYLIVAAVDAIGRAVKIAAFAFGGVVLVGSVALGSQAHSSQLPIYIIVGFVLGSIVALPLFVLGILVSAHAQVLKATLDSSVHTSPFLEDTEKAIAMSL